MADAVFFLPHKKVKLKRYESYLSLAPPLGIAYLAAMLRTEGYDVKLSDLQHDFLQNPSEFFEFLKKENPKLIGATVTTALSSSVREYVTQIKNILPNSFIVLGGPHPSAIGAPLLESITSADGIVAGEGEYAVLELMHQLEKSKPNLEKVQGLSFRKANGKIHNGGRTDLIKNLDVLPFPAIDLFSSLENYKIPLNIMTSRGCPFSCVYCFKGIFGPLFRPRSPESVVNELAYYKEKYPKLYKEKPLAIADDCFNVDMDRAKRICDLIVEKGLQTKFVCGTGLRGDRIDEELVRKLKKIGVFFIFFGVESGNQKQVYDIGKGLDLKKLERGIKITKKAGITAGACFIVDLPGTNKYTIRDTINYMKKLSADKYHACFATPYPGTKLDEWINNTPGVKRLSTDLAFDKDRPFFETAELPKEAGIAAFNEIVGVANKITLKRYLHPKRFLKVLSNIRTSVYAKQKLKQLAWLLSNKKVRSIG